MDIFSSLIVIFGLMISYYMGKSAVLRQFGTKQIELAVQHATIPVGVLEKIEDNYYLYEKDSTNFLCQATSLDEIPVKLWENKKISLALILFPDEMNTQTFWCINGKMKTIQGA